MARWILTVFIGTTLLANAVITVDRYDFRDLRQQRVGTTNQRYRSQTTNQPNRASTTNQRYRSQTTNQRYRSQTTNQPNRASTTNQPNRAQTTNQPHRLQTTNQPHRVQTTNEQYRVPTTNQPNREPTVAVQRRLTRNLASWMPTTNQAITNKAKQALVDNQAPHPTSVIGLNIDKVYLKYALGLTCRDAGIFNLSLAAGSYYNVYQALGDARVASGQFVQSYALHNLLVRNMCFTTRIFRLIIVSIASDFQDVIRDKLDDLEPALKEILPELPEGAEDLEAIAPEMLTILLLKYTVFPILSSAVDSKYFKDFEKVVERELKYSDSVSTFIHNIEEFVASNSPPECSNLSDVATILHERVPAISEAFSDNILPIIAKLRNAFDLHGLNIETSTVNGLFSTLQPDFVEIIKAYGNIVSVKGCSELMESVGIPLPMNPNDFLQPDDPALQTIQQLMRQLIGDESPLKDFMEYIKGSSTMPELFNAVYDAEY